MAKELCKLRKSILKDDVEQWMRLVDNPSHVCTKCGRAANSKKLLCSPTKIRAAA